MKSKYWLAVLACVLMISVGLSVWVLWPGEPATQARVLSDGKVVAAVDLAEDQEFTISAPDGGENVVTVKDGKIAVTEASCPDHYCRDRGFCSGGVDIVCLPNKMVIRFLGEQEVDAVLG